MTPVFQIFGFSHILVIVFSFCLLALVFFTREWHKKNQATMAKIIGFGGLLFFPVHFLIYTWVLQSFDIRFDLPVLQICGIILLSISLYLLVPNFRLKGLFYNILFFWGISATLVAFLVPALDEDFPHIYFWLFWVSHWLIVYCLSFVLLIRSKNVKYHNLWQSIAIFLIYLLLIYPFNLITSSNYAFVIHKPEIIHFGVILGIDFDVSPNYILLLILLGSALFHLIFFIYRAMDMKKDKNTGRQSQVDQAATTHYLKQ